MAIALQTNKLQALTDLVFTVATDDNASNVITADEFGRFVGIMINAPSAVTGTITLAVLNDFEADETLDASFNTLQSPPGTDIEIAAGKSIVISPLPAAAIRLESSGTEAADRTFTVYGILETVTG